MSERCRWWRSPRRSGASRPWLSWCGPTRRLSEADVLAWCNGKLARYKQPKSVQFVDEIPRNASGKALKRILRDRFPDPAPE